jgi:hypothetical protein
MLSEPPGSLFGFVYIMWTPSMYIGSNCQGTTFEACNLYLYTENWWLESDISPLTYIAVGPLTAITTKNKTDLPQPVESTISKLSAHHSSTDNTGWNSTVEFLRNSALMQIRCCGWPQQFGIPAEPTAVPHKIRQDGSLDRSTYIAREYDASGCTFLDKHQPNATGAAVAQPPIHSLTDSYCYFTRIRSGITFVRVRPWIHPAYWCDLCLSSFPTAKNNCFSVGGRCKIGLSLCKKRQLASNRSKPRNHPTLAMHRVATDAAGCCLCVGVCVCTLEPSLQMQNVAVQTTIGSPQHPGGQLHSQQYRIFPPVRTFKLPCSTSKKAFCIHNSSVGNGAQHKTLLLNAAAAKFYECRAFTATYHPTSSVVSHGGIHRQVAS